MSGTPARKSKHPEKQDSKSEPSEVTRRSTTTSTPYNRSSPSKRKPGSATSGSTRASGASRRKTALGENDALGRSNAVLGESESVWEKTNVARRKRSAWGRGSMPLEKPDDLLPQAYAVLHGTASKKVGLETFVPVQLSVSSGLRGAWKDRNVRESPKHAGNRSRARTAQPAPTARRSSSPVRRQALEAPR